MKKREVYSESYNLGDDQVVCSVCGEDISFEEKYNLTYFDFAVNGESGFYTYQAYFHKKHKLKDVEAVVERFLFHSRFVFR